MKYLPLAKEFGQVTWMVYEYVTDAESSGATGEQKKADVIKRIMAELRDADGVQIKSEWILGIVEWALPRMIDKAVAYFKAHGLFS